MATPISASAGMEDWIVSRLKEDSVDFEKFAFSEQLNKPEYASLLCTGKDNSGKLSDYDKKVFSFGMQHFGGMKGMLEEMISKSERYKCAECKARFERALNRFAEICSRYPSADSQETATSDKDGTGSLEPCRVRIAHHNFIYERCAMRTLLYLMIAPTT